MPSFPWLDSNATPYFGIGYLIQHYEFYMIPMVGIAGGAWLLATLLSRKWSSEHAAITALWVYSLISYRSVMGRNDLYHLLFAISPSLILLFVLIDRIWAVLKSAMAANPGKVNLEKVVLAGAVVFLFLNPIAYKEFWGLSKDQFISSHLLKKEQDIELNYTLSHFVPLNLKRAKGIWVEELQAKLLEPSTDFISKYTARKEPLHIAPYYGVYLFLADRVPLTRYILTIEAITPESRKQMTETIKARKPRIIFAEFDEGMDYTYREEHPEEVKYILDHYEFRGKIGYVNVYVLKGETGK